MMKKIALFLSLILVCGLFVACGEAPVKNLEGTSEDIMHSVYDLIPEINDDNMENWPMVDVMPISPEMSEMFLGIPADRYKDAATGDSMVGAIAYSVCIVRANSMDDVEQLKKDIEENADPRKWICVEAEKVIVDNIGDTIILIMSDEEMSTKVHEAFLSLGK